jgi:hypothetical protein
MEHNLLVAARSEYTEKLQDMLSESIYGGIKEIWGISKINKKSPLVEFQQKLCEVPKWNQDMIDTICKKIVVTNDISFEYLDKIIEAVFLSNIKILSVVKLNDEKQTIDVVVPDTKNFIHKCYIESARRFYTDPYLIDDRESGSNTKHEMKRNVKRSNSTVKDSIEKTIRSMIPMEDILTKYLASVAPVSSNTSVSSNEQVHQEEPEFEPQQEQEQELEPVPEQSQDWGQTVTEEVEEQTVDDLFQKEPNQDHNPQQEQLSQEQEKIHIDLKEPEKHFYSDSE